MMCDTIGYCLYWDVVAGEAIGQFKELHTELQQISSAASRAHCLPAGVPAVLPVMSS